MVQVFGPPEVRLARFAEIASEGASSGRVVRLARTLRNASRSDRHCARLIQEIGQSLPYFPDRPGGADDVREPCRVLDVGGDCEDLSILVAALDLAAGLTPRLSWHLQREAENDHVSVEVLVNGVWLFQEPTIKAELGENPYTAARRLNLGAL